MAAPLPSFFLIILLNVLLLLLPIVRLPLLPPSQAAPAGTTTLSYALKAPLHRFKSIFNTFSISIPVTAFVATALVSSSLSISKQHAYVAHKRVLNGPDKLCEFLSMSAVSSSNCLLAVGCFSQEKRLIAGCATLQLSSSSSSRMAPPSRSQSKRAREGLHRVMERRKKSTLPLTMYTFRDGQL